MKARLTIILLYLLITSSSFALEREQLIGEWSAGGIRNIIGEGLEHRVSFTLSDGHLELIFKTVSYGSVNTKTPPKEISSGPYSVKRLTSNRLIYVKDGHEYHVTLRLSVEGLLEWGALVSDDNQKWSYAKETPLSVIGSKDLMREGSAEWTFKSDPFKVPVGEAGVPGLLAGHAYYIHEKIPSYETGGLPQRCIRVMTLNEDGTVSEQFRMIWTKLGGPYFEGTFSKGTNLRSLTTEILQRLPSKK